MTPTRLARAVVVTGVFAGSLGASTIIATVALAAFNATASASQSISSRSLTAPGSLTAIPSGHNVDLSWTAGANGNGYALLGVANGTSNNCATATFSALTTTTATSYTDTGRYQPQGTYYCYQAQTSYNTWSSTTSNPTVAAQIGFVAQSIQITNGGTAGKLDAGDKLTITYNQPVTTATALVTGNMICTNAASTGNIIMIGDAVTGCNASTAVSVGTISSGTSTKTAAYNLTWAWSNNNTTLTITVGSRISGSQDSSISGTLTFSPTTSATSVLSATGSYHNCDSNTGGGNCTPTASGAF